MAITDKEYEFIISLCEWNNPDTVNLNIQSRNPNRLNLRPTLTQLENDARRDGFTFLADITQFMDDYLTTVQNNETRWFAEIEGQVRIEYG